MNGKFRKLKNWKISLKQQHNGVVYENQFNLYDCTLDQANKVLNTLYDATGDVKRVWLEEVVE